MAKKTVASLQTGVKNLTKVIKMVRSEKTGAYAFKESIVPKEKVNDFFAKKLACETECSDVYADIKADNKNYILLDVRSTEAFDKSHAITAVSMTHSDINSESFAKYDKDTLFVVYLGEFLISLVSVGVPVCFRVIPSGFFFGMCSLSSLDGDQNWEVVTSHVF